MPCVCANVSSARADARPARRPRRQSRASKAYRSAAKLWHPDRFETTPRPSALEAEEHFKLIQVAYRELSEHYENPLKLSSRASPKSPRRSSLLPPAESASPAPRSPKTTALSPSAMPPAASSLRTFPPTRVRSFSNATWKPPSGPWPSSTSRPPAAARRQFSQFILLTSPRVFVRNALNIVCLPLVHRSGRVSASSISAAHGKPTSGRASWTRSPDLDPNTRLKFTAATAPSFTPSAGRGR